MAKIVLDTVTGGYDLSVINNNFDKIETELQNKVLYRDNPAGEPNTLQTNIDCNNKTLFNASSVNTQSLTLNGQIVTPANLAISAIPSPSGQVNKIFRSDGSTAYWDANTTGILNYTQGAAGSVSRTLTNKLNELISVKDFGGNGDGITSNDVVFTLSPLKHLHIPTGDYFLTSDWRPAAQDAFIFADADVEFSNSSPDYENLIPYQESLGDIWSHFLLSKTYGTSWSSYGNIFQVASYAKANITGPNVVAIFGGAEAKADQSHCWGGNFVAYASHATGVSIGIELNCGVLAPGGTAYGLVIASAGTAGQPNNAIQLQSNEPTSQFVNGIYFNFQAIKGGITGALVAGAGVSGSTCERFLYMTSLRATQAEIDLPSFAVAASPITPANRILITGSQSGSGVSVGATGIDVNIPITVQSKGNGIISLVSNNSEQLRVINNVGNDFLSVGAGTGGGIITAIGASVNADVVLTGKGTGGVRLQDGTGTNKVLINTTGIGFNAATPIAKPSISGSRGGNAALASLLSALASYGLVTDNTTA